MKNAGPDSPLDHTGEYTDGSHPRAVRTETVGRKAPGGSHLTAKDMSRNPIGAMQVTAASNDEMRWLTRLSVAGLFTAAVLAVIGGMPFDLPMPTHTVGWVDPTCGLTRGSTAIVRGDLALAWRYNPFSFAVIGLGAAGLLRLVAGAWSGRWITIRVRLRPAGWLLLVTAALAFWLYQQSNAEFIIHSRL